VAGWFSQCATQAVDRQCNSSDQQLASDSTGVPTEATEGSACAQALLSLALGKDSHHLNNLDQHCSAAAVAVSYASHLSSTCLNTSKMTHMTQLLSMKCWLVLVMSMCCVSGEPSLHVQQQPVLCTPFHSCTH
jgi:hypothetical protein